MTTLRERMTQDLRLRRCDTPRVETAIRKPASASSAEVTSVFHADATLQPPFPAVVDQSVARSSSRPGQGSHKRKRGILAKIVQS